MIELAKPEDIVQIYALSVASYLENGSDESGISINMDKSLATIAHCINSQSTFVDRDETNPKIINGFVMCSVNTLWFSTDFIIIGLMFYIKPEKRTFRRAKSLMYKAKEYAIMNKVPLAFDIFGQKDVHKKKQLFKYLGFEEWGSSYVYTHKEM